MENPSPLPLLHDTKVSGVHFDPCIALYGLFAVMTNRAGHIQGITDRCLMYDAKCGGDQTLKIWPEGGGQLSTTGPHG